MHVINVFRLSALFFLFAIERGHADPDCTALITTCLSDANCGPLAAAYRTNCLAEFQGSSTTTTCSATCKNAWSALLLDAIGVDFSTCTCSESDDAFVSCSIERTLFSKTCLSKTIQPLCNNVLGYCATRPNCVSLMPAYFRSCNGTGNPNKTCISECRSAVEPLAQNEVGALLGQCYCKADDMECKDFQTVSLDCGLITIVPTGTEGPTGSGSLPGIAAFALVVVALVYLLI